MKGRTDILRVHARDKKLCDSVELKEIAKLCVGMSGADLQNVLNEAAIFCARKKKSIIEMEDVQDAVQKLQIGLEKKDKEFSDKR